MAEQEKIGLVGVLDLEQFERSVNTFNQAMQGMTRQTEQAEQQTKRSSANIGDALASIGKVAAGVFGADVFKGLINGIKGMAQEASAVPGISATFSALGGDIQKMRQATLGMTQDVDLMKSYNMAAQLVGKGFAEQLPEAMGLLSKAAQSTGQDMQYMIDSLVRGVGRLSPMILDNLGIQVNLTEANEAYAKSIGKTADDLSKSEQQTAMMNLVMEKLRFNLKDVPSVAGTATQTFASFQTTLANLKTEIGTSLLPMFGGLMQVMSQVVSAVAPVITSLAQGVAGALESKVLPLLDRFSSILQGQLAAGAKPLEAISAALQNIVPPGIADAIQWLSDAIEYLTNLEPQTLEFAKTLGKIVLAVGGVSEAWNLLSTALAVNPFILAITAAAALVTAVEGINESLNKTRDAVALETESLARAGTSYEEYEQAVRAAIAARHEGEFAPITIAAETKQVLLTRDAYAELQQAMQSYAGTGAADLMRSFHDIEAAQADVQAGIQQTTEASAESAIIIDEYGNTVSLAMQSIEAATEEAANSIKEADIAAIYEEQTVSIAQKAEQFGRKMVEIDQKAADARSEAQFKFARESAEAEAKYQQERAILLAQGKTVEAAQLAAKYQQQTAQRSAAYAYDQKMAERNQIIQRIQQQRAYILELQDLRTQTLRKLQMKIKEGISEGQVLTETQKSQLRVIAAQGPRILAVETEAYIDRMEAQRNFAGHMISMTSGMVQGIYAVTSSATRSVDEAMSAAENSQAALEAELKAMESELLSTMPPMPPLDTSAWGASVDAGVVDITTGATNAEEIATRTLSSVVSDIDQAVTAAMSAIDKLVDFDVPTGVDIGLGRLADFIKISVESLYNTFDQVHAKMVNMSSLLDPVSGLMGIISTATQAMGGVKLAELPNMQVWADQFATVVVTIADALRWLRDRMTEVGLKDAAAQVDNIAKVISLATFELEQIATAKRLPNMQQWADQFVAVAEQVARAILRVTDLLGGGERVAGRGALREAAAMTENISKVLSLVKEGIDALGMIAKYTIVTNLRQRVKSFTDDMVTVAKEFMLAFQIWTGKGGALAGFGDTEQPAIKWWENVTKISSVVKDGIDVLTALSKYEAIAGLRQKVSEFASNMAVVAEELMRTFTALTKGTGSLRDLTETDVPAQTWWNNVEALTGTIKNGIDALTAIADYTPVNSLRDKITAFATDLGWTAWYLLDAFKSWTGGGGTILPIDVSAFTEANAWWTAVKNITTVLKDGVSSLEAIADYAPVKNLPDKVIAFSEDLGWAAWHLLEGFRCWTLEGPGPQHLPIDIDIFTAANKWWTAVKDVTAVLKDGVASLSAIADYAPIKNIAEKTIQFSEDLGWVAWHLLEGFRAWTGNGPGPQNLPGNLDLFDAASKWWNAVKGLITIIKEGTEALKAIAGYSAVSDLETKITQFRSDLNVIAREMMKAVMPDRSGGVGTWPEIEEAALIWWQSVKGLIDIIKPGIDALSALSDYSAIENLEAKITQFRSDLNAVAHEMMKAVMPDRSGGVGTWPEIEEAALIWWQSVKGLIDIIKPGIDALSALSGYMRIENVTESIAGLSGDLALVAEELSRAFEAWSGEANLTPEALAWWDSVKQIIDVVKPGVDALAALGGYVQSRDLTAKTDAFIAALKGVVLGLVRAMSAEGMPSLEGAKAAADYFAAVKTIVEAIVPASEAIGRLVGASIVDIATLRIRFPKFQANLVYVVTAMSGMVDAMETAGIEKAKTFGDRMRDISQALTDGLGVFNDIRNRAQGGDPHNAIDALWKFVREVANALQQAIDQVKAKLWQMEQAFYMRVPAAYQSGYAYGVALGRGVREGFYASLGTLTVTLPPLTPQGAGAGMGNTYYQTVQVGGINFQNVPTNALDLQSVGDYVVQRIVREMAR